MKALALLLLLSAVPAHAAVEGAYVSWDGCHSSVLAKSFTGPGVYSMTITVAGSARTIAGYSLQIEVMDPLAQCARGAFPPAWEFEEGGCNAGRWSVSYAPSAGCLSVGGVLGTLQVYEGGFYAEARRIRIEVLLAQPVTLEADKTYHLATIAFDHGNSSASAGPGQCEGAGEPICLYLSSAVWTDSQNQGGKWNDWMTGLNWNPDQGYYGCPFLCDAALPSTWGSVKASYR